MIKKFYKIILVVALSFVGAAHAQVAIINEIDDGSARRMSAFEQVWKTVNERHYDPTFGGLGLE